MTTSCHNACQSVDLRPQDITLVEVPMLFTQPADKPNTRWEARAGDRFLAMIDDQGFRVHPDLGGDWRSSYVVFAGGAIVLLDRHTWMDGAWVRTSTSLPATVKALAKWCQATSFSWRMALHPPKY